jgi:hypothetical protein
MVVLLVFLLGSNVFLMFHSSELQETNTKLQKQIVQDVELNRNNQKENRND